MPLRIEVACTGAASRSAANSRRSSKLRLRAGRDPAVVGRVVGRDEPRDARRDGRREQRALGVDDHRTRAAHGRDHDVDARDRPGQRGVVAVGGGDDLDAGFVAEARGGGPAAGPGEHAQLHVVRARARGRCGGRGRRWRRRRGWWWSWAGSQSVVVGGASAVPVGSRREDARRGCWISGRGSESAWVCGASVRRSRRSPCRRCREPRGRGVGAGSSARRREVPHEHALDLAQGDPRLRRAGHGRRRWDGPVGRGRSAGSGRRSTNPPASRASTT